ncbi:MAG: peptidylprolyl isomerase [Ardenticatenales bacterium]|nr:peptidylprolyl isomerase [Ardenticatenales bacterium]
MTVYRSSRRSVEEEPARPLADIPTAERNGYYSRPPEMSIDASHDYRASILTDKGEIVLDLFENESPVAVNSFVFLARQGFYDGTTFHRVLDGFMAQAGDPTGTGSGGPGYAFEDEVRNDLSFDRAGLLAMANSGPNTNGSQFFITFVPTPHLDGRHTIFGEVVEGQDVLDSLTRRDPQASPASPSDSILRVTILEDGVPS